MTNRFAVRHDPEDILMIAGYPAPPIDPIDRRHAAAAIFKLMANKEDTRQVFEVIYSLSGDSYHRMFERFAAEPYGRRFLRDQLDVEPILNDRAALRALPAGSLGRAYLAFMEAENLSAEGVTGAAQEAGCDYACDTQFPDYRRLNRHMEVVHDLWHVVTGYERDALGELCLLAFTYEMTHSEGLRWIATVGGLVSKAERPGLPILKAIDEGHRNGRRAAWLPSMDVETLLPRPLDEVRRLFNVEEPRVYASIAPEDRDAILRPRVTRTQAEREAGAAAAA
ncbi:MAG: Coq4 family protein [Pseudomonadota bacterium]